MLKLAWLLTVRYFGIVIQLVKQVIAQFYVPGDMQLVITRKWIHESTMISCVGPKYQAWRRFVTFIMTQTQEKELLHTRKIEIWISELQLNRLDDNETSSSNLYTWTRVIYTGCQVIQPEDIINKYTVGKCYAWLSLDIM